MDSPPSRNPEAPDEYADKVIHADSIGATAYSKQWLLSTLLKLAKFQGGDEQGPADEDDSACDDKAYSVNLSDTFQDELSQLWDMTMDSEVAVFLKDYDPVNILTGVIVNSKSPRALEIAIGILGNLACHPATVEQLAVCKDLVHVSLLLLDSPDPPTLVEATRFLSTVLSCSTTRPTWLTAIEDSSDLVRDSITFILHSSNRGDLLQNVAKFVDTLFDLSQNTMCKWIEVGLDCPEGRSSFLAALLEAMQQVGCKTPKKMYTFVHILQLLTCAEVGVLAVAIDSPSVTGILLTFLNYLRREKNRQHACTAMASVLSVFSAVVTACGLSKQTNVNGPLQCAVDAIERCRRWTQDRVWVGFGKPPIHLHSNSPDHHSTDIVVTASESGEVEHPIAGGGDGNGNRLKEELEQGSSAGGIAEAGSSGKPAEDGAEGWEGKDRDASSDHSEDDGGDSNNDNADGTDDEWGGSLDSACTLNEVAWTFVADVAGAAASAVLNIHTEQAPRDTEWSSVGSALEPDTELLLRAGDVPEAKALRCLDLACSSGRLTDLGGMLPAPTRLHLFKAAQLLQLSTLIQRLR